MNKHHALRRPLLAMLAIVDDLVKTYGNEQAKLP